MAGIKGILGTGNGVTNIMEYNMANIAIRMKQYSVHGTIENIPPMVKNSKIFCLLATHDCN